MEDAEKHLSPKGIVAHDENGPANPGRVPHLLVFSAQDEGGVERLEAACNGHFEKNAESCQDQYLSRLASTLSTRRSHFLWRSFTIVASMDALKHGLKLSSPVKALKAPRLALCFTGQGAQWHGMGRELQMYECFSKGLAECATELRALGCPWDLFGKIAGLTQHFSVDITGDCR